MMLSGWGRYPRVDCQVSRPRSEGDLCALVEAGPLIARGNGRSYGDCAPNSDRTVDMRRINRLLSFDEKRGQVVAEAGVMLQDVIEAFLPQGWFPSVTPGTKFVTIGGMVAADVHGKNHHRDGSFAEFIDWIDVLGSDGAVRHCSAVENPELFAWTIGGMGLTGIILRVAFRLRSVESAWIWQQTLSAPDLDTTISLFEENADAAYTVAWIDCLARGAQLGRSAVILGEHATRDELPAARKADPYCMPDRKVLGVPFELPVTPLNRFTVRAFNQAYWLRSRGKPAHQLVDIDSYFYPLDGMTNWNRIYGPNGFTQFQCVIPLDAARAGLTQLIEEISSSGRGSFLSVLKRLGRAAGKFSFPLEGYTLAMDFPVSAAAMRLLDRLDEIVVRHGGRFYLAKDSRMSPETLRASDSRVADFLAARRSLAAAPTFQSSQSQRLGL